MKFVNRFWKLSCLMMLCTLVFGMSAVPVFAGGEPEVYASAESFTWKEFGDAGDRLLKESGPRYGVGFAYAHEFPNHLTLKPRVELTGGDVDYDGQTQSGLPVTSTTTYFGFKFEFDMGGKIKPSKSFAIEPFAGLGVRAWARDINDSTTFDGGTVYYVNGYTEHWTTFYGRVGLRGDLYFGQRSKLFFEAGVKLPISTENYINDWAVSYEEITLKPGNKDSLFAEVGVRLSRFKITAFYDSMRFKKSPVVYDYDPFWGTLTGYLQPRSESDIYGVRIGASF